MNSQEYRNLQEAYLNVYQEIDEAEGSYGQTPKATAAYIALATRRGGKKSTKSKALQHAIRSSARQSINTPSHRSNMTPSDRTYYRGQDENRGGDREDIDFDGGDGGGIDFDAHDTGPSGPGGMPKGKKLKRQRIRGISASYEPDLFDVILEYLITEGYADTEDSAFAIMANMSEDWRESICEDYKPWDFGPKQKAKRKYDQLVKDKAAGNSPPGTATRANTIASVAKDMRTTLDKNSASTGTNPAKQGLQPATRRHTAAALRGAGGGMTASKTYDVKPLNRR